GRGAGGARRRRAPGGQGGAKPPGAHRLVAAGRVGEGNRHRHGRQQRTRPAGGRARRPFSKLVANLATVRCAIVTSRPSSACASRPSRGNHVIEAQDLTKRYGDKLAVDHLSFRVEPGRVTGFLGPNGAGKSTTMRLMLGLDRPAAGRATINGRPYTELAQPLPTAGAPPHAPAMH